MKTFSRIFALLGIVGVIGGLYECKAHAILLGFIMICGAVAIDINNNKTKQND
jgi:hypothetical protein